MIGLGISPDLSPDALLAMEALGDDPGSRNVAIVLARLFSSENMPDVVKALKEVPDDFAQIDAELRQLHADASEDEIISLAERAAAIAGDFLAAAEGTLPTIDTSIGEQAGTDAMMSLIAEYMNPAQHRVMALLIERLAQGHE